MWGTEVHHFYPRTNVWGMPAPYSWVPMLASSHTKSVSSEEESIIMYCLPIFFAKEVKYTDMKATG